MMVDAKEIKRRLENGVAMVSFFRKKFQQSERGIKWKGSWAWDIGQPMHENNMRSG